LNLPNQMEKIIDAQLARLQPEEIAGAWRCLCSMMLCQTAVSYRRRSSHRKEDVIAKRRAKEWVYAGNEGIISFDEACEGIDVDSERAAKAFDQFARDEKTKTISRTVYGVRCYA